MIDPRRNSTYERPFTREGNYLVKSLLEQQYQSVSCLINLLVVARKQPTAYIYVLRNQLGESCCLYVRVQIYTE